MKPSCYMAFLLLLLWAACTTPEKKDARVDTFHTYLSALEEHYNFNGNVLVAEKGNIIYQESFGVADCYTQRPLNDSSVFELASVSKQFTAMSILLLVDKGKLSLEDSLRKFFPELPYQNITIHHMLTHTSGLPDYFDLMIEKWDHSRIAFNEDMIAFLAKERPPVLFKPGEKWEYSNTAFAMLATITEKVSGMSFREYMDANIFKPLDMQKTRVYNTRRSSDDRIDNYAYGFVWDDKTEKYALPDSLEELTFVYYMDGIQGDGIVNTTTEDLLKWDRAMVDGKVLGESNIAKLLTKHALVDTASEGYYGYGIGLGKDRFGERISHSGGWPGYSTYYKRYPREDYTIIILSNNNSLAGSISNGLASVLFGTPLEMPQAHTRIDLDSAAMSSFAVTFKENGNRFRIVYRNDSLIRIHESGSSAELVPASTNLLFMPSRTVDRQYIFEKDEQGKRRLYSIVMGVRDELEIVE